MGVKRCKGCVMELDHFDRILISVAIAAFGIVSVFLLGPKYAGSPF